MRSGSLLLLFAALARAQCPNMCNGHGRCGEVNRCECFASWTGGDCSLRKCPTGTAWADIASDDEVAHQESECSNRGQCDHKSGQCVCFQGYEGIACNRMICPADCAAHGECHSMRHHAQTVDKGVIKVPNPYTNVRSAYGYKNIWDADMIHGCSCDTGYEGWDCGDRRCPRGDDPMTTGQPDELQLLRCDIDPTDPAYAGPQFTMSFRGAITRPISPSASPADLRSYLEELATIGQVEIVYTNGGVTLCDATYQAAGTDPDLQPAGSNVVMIRFLDNHGDLPRLVVLDQHGKPLYGAKDNLLFTAAKGETLVRTTSLYPVTTEVIASVTGSKEDTECSGRGRCDKRTGVCQCYTGYTGSDGRGNRGVNADCGYPFLPITSCPGVGIECSGHGTCSGNPAYTCACYEGFTGGDCSLRTCPSGRAWFDFPSAPDTAHAVAECSNKGYCDRTSGQCQCQSLFEGQACERMTCPGKTSPLGVCSGHGQCLSMSELAEYSNDNGDPTPHTYGSDPNSIYTWDSDSVYGCMCDQGWTGFDCSQRTCPLGNDITLLEANDQRLDEAQTLNCKVLDPSQNPKFALSFRGAETPLLPYSSTAAQLQSALQSLPSIGQIDVLFASTSSGILPPQPEQACLPGPSGQTITFVFRTEHGDVPPIRVVMDEDSRDPITREYGFASGFLDTQLEWAGGDPASSPSYNAGPYTYQKTPTYDKGGIRALEVRKGQSGNAECSGRGICDRDSGQCQCFLGFGSSNNDRGPGEVENCGWREPYTPQRLRVSH